MGLAGEDELHGPVGVAEDLRDQIQVAHHEVGPLVGGEPPGETDRQRLRIEALAQSLQNRIVEASPLGLRDQPRSRVNDQPVLERLVRLPQFAGRHLLKAGPDLRLAGAQVPVDRQHAVVQARASARPARSARARRW